MKHLKIFEEYKFGDNESDNEYDLEQLIPKSKVIELFKKHGLSCDENENPRLNEITYENDYLTIYCMYSSYAYDGRMPKNISEVMSDISDSLGADDWEFGAFRDTVFFSFDPDELNEIK